jgi:hypothetical protein
MAASSGGTLSLRTTEELAIGGGSVGESHQPCGPVVMWWIFVIDGTLALANLVLGVRFLL